MCFLYVWCGRQNFAIQEEAKDIRSDFTYHERECFNCKKKNKFLQKLSAIIEEVSWKGSMCIVCFVVVVLLKWHKKFGMSAMHT